MGLACDPHIKMRPVWMSPDVFSKQTNKQQADESPRPHGFSASRSVMLCTQVSEGGEKSLALTHRKKELRPGKQVGSLQLFLQIFFCTHCFVPAPAPAGTPWEPELTPTSQAGRLKEDLYHSLLLPNLFTQSHPHL